MTVIAPDGTVTVFPISLLNRIVYVPTTGATVRITGTNLGDAPLLHAGVAVGVVLVPCAGVSDQTCYEGDAPPGEGDGLQPELGGAFASSEGFVLVVAAADQLSQVITFRYLSPVITSVVPNSSLSFPTAGGAPVSILGYNFGSLMPGSDPSSITVMLMASAELAVRSMLKYAL